MEVIKTKRVPWNKGLKGAHKHSKESRRKMSESHRGQIPWNKGKTGIYSDETTARRIASVKASYTSERRDQYRAKMSGSSNPAKRPEFRKLMSGEYNPMKRPEVRAKISGENNPMKRPEVRAKISEIVKERYRTHDNPFKGKTHSEENRRKFSILASVKTGERNPNWQGGISTSPYCFAFSFEVREHIRNLCSRTCTVCGKSALQHTSRLAVDHLDENKLQGCDDWKWRLTSLCRSCHGKMNSQETHLFLRLLLLNNKRHQTNLMFEYIGK